MSCEPFEADFIETRQHHTHELVGSAHISDGHNHHFVLVTGEAIFFGNNHFHNVQTRTDYYENHFHKICGRTGYAVNIGGGCHVHLLQALTSVNEGHRHRLRANTLISNPTGDR